MKFIQGDILNDAFVGTEAPSHESDIAPFNVDIDALKTLAPLRGKLSVIHTSKFFHLFSEAEQLAIARTLAALLSRAPGSMIVGAHISRPQKGLRLEAPPPRARIHREPDVLPFRGVVDGAVGGDIWKG